MDSKKKIEFEYKLIEVLKGKFNLLINQQERGELVENAIKSTLELIDFKCLKEELDIPKNRIIFVEEFLSYGKISELLCDLNVEDIIINNLKPIYIHHAQLGLISTHKKFESQLEIEIFIEKLLLFSGRSKMRRLMNLELPNLEGRVNIALSTFGPQITITKAKTSPLSILDLIRTGAMSYEVAALLWLYIEGMSIMPANIIIAGGPGVGKTTLLNALFSFIPSSERIVVIEDTLELNTFMEESCSRLESDEELSLADLVKNSLRMRPERIIVGEVRGDEARDMITACNIGKYCIGTIHALTSREAIIRLQNEPMNVPEMLVNLIDVFIVLKRYHVKDKLFRVIDEVSETSGMEQVKILLSHVYKYDYERRTLRLLNPSTVYRDRLAKQAGITPKAIMQEQLFRAYLLEQMDKKNMTTIKEISTFCRAYNRNPDETSSNFGVDRKKMLESSVLGKWGS